MHKYPLATFSWDSAETEAMQQVIASGNFTMGSKVAAFEAKFAEYFQSKHCVMVNSGSSANLLMVAALFYTKNSKYQLKPGDEVIVPAVSWSTTYFPLAQYGLHLKFVDIDLQTLNYDLKALAAAITAKTRVIMAVNLLGNPNDFAMLQKLIANRNIIILEDNCESMGSTFAGKYTGSFGLMGSFSSFFSHHISTMEGGMVITDDPELQQIMVCLRAHGWTRQLPVDNLVCSRKNDDAFLESYRFILPGYNLRPLELSAAIGLEQLKKLPKIISERQKNGQVWQELFNNHADVYIQQETGQSSWFGFSLIIKPQARLGRQELIHKLEQLGFECRPIVAGNFVKNEVIKYIPHEISGGVPNAEYLDEHGLFIGNQHYDLSEGLRQLHAALV